MHNAEMPDSAGEFGAPVVSDVTCRKCRQSTVVETEWDSSCGGWTDYHYHCTNCAHTWWVDGLDS